MALPKEPRQKMINMMYLVLTALLALNVSAEVIIAFRTVNASIGEANRIITDKNNMTYGSFEAKLKDSETRERAERWKPFADNAKKESEALYSYIEDLKQNLKKESGLEVHDGVESFKEDNLDAPTRVMVEGGKGKELLSKLEAYKKNMLALVQDKTKQAEFAKSLPLDLNPPKSETGSSANKDWSSAYFRMTPSIAAITILSKFQNDVKSSEAQLVDYFHSQIGQVQVVYDAFQAFAGTNSTYLMPGQELEITAGVGAFSSKSKPSITINGAAQPLNADGAAVWKSRVDGVGSHKVPVKITYTKPDGTQATIDKVIEYTVGSPSGASIFLEKMNVLYQGVENPLTISGGSVGSEKVSVRFTGGELRKVGGDRYIAIPNKTGPAEIIVTADGKSTPFSMRCKVLPDPVVMVGGSGGGAMASANFKAQGGLIAKLKDSDFDAPFKVISYVLGAKGGEIASYQQFANDGPRWSGNAAGLINRATPGTSIFFDEIRVQGPDGKIRAIPGIFFNLK
ncbi:MAG: gliding motility protein GldM [Chitinophagaceae bacterium]